MNLTTHTEGLNTEISLRLLAGVNSFIFEKEYLHFLNDWPTLVEIYNIKRKSFHKEGDYIYCSVPAKDLIKNYPKFITDSRIDKPIKHFSIVLNNKYNQPIQLISLEGDYSDGYGLLWEIEAAFKAGLNEKDLAELEIDYTFRHNGDFVEAYSINWFNPEPFLLLGKISTRNFVDQLECAKREFNQIRMLYRLSLVEHH
jgi:hypothetical protein